MNTVSTEKPIAKSDLAGEPAEELHILKIVKSLREGEFIADLDEQFQAALNAATSLGKPAKITVTFDITPAGRTVVVSDDIKPKTPAEPKDATIYYVGEGNKLTRKDPKQATFPVEAGFGGKAAPAVNG